MQLLGIIQKIRDLDGWASPKEKFKELRQAIAVLREHKPLVARVVTRQKTWAGRIDKLKFHNGHNSRRNAYLKFTTTDCDRNGQSRKTAKTYRVKVPFDDLMDIHDI